MHLLYADESGSPKDPNQNYLVLAGVSVFERQSFWISNELDKIAARFDPANPDEVELHGSPMMSGRGRWRRYPKDKRFEAVGDILQVLANSHISNRIFASVIKKSSISPADPVETAFEQLSNRFDLYLMRLHRNSDTQRGIIIFDKSTYESSLQALATNFRTIGHSWGVLRNLAEVPLFLDSKASRLIQLADIIAYVIFRYYEVSDNRFFPIIKSRFDAEGDNVHGLHVIQ